MTEHEEITAAKAPRRWYVLRCNRRITKIRDVLTSLRNAYPGSFDYFLPTRFVLIHVGDRQRRVEKSVAFNFVFVNCPYLILQQLMKIGGESMKIQYRRVLRGDSLCRQKDRLLVVPESEMEMFIRTVGAYDGDIPAVLPEEADLEKGDRVRIVGGQFDGIEGVLVTRQGKDGGRVLVRVSDVLCVPTLEIEPECLEILEFAPESRHLYKKFDSYIRKVRHALKAVLYHEMGLALPPVSDEALCAAYANVSKGRTEGAMFLRRFGSFRPATVNQRARKTVFMLMSYRVLGQQKEWEALLPEVGELDKLLTAPTQRAFLAVYLYGITGERLHLSRAIKAMAGMESAKRSDGLRDMLSADLHDFRHIYGHA